MVVVSQRTTNFLGFFSRQDIFAMHDLSSEVPLLSMNIRWIHILGNWFVVGMGSIFINSRILREGFDDFIA